MFPIPKAQCSIIQPPDRPVRSECHFPFTFTLGTSIHKLLSHKNNTNITTNTTCTSLYSTYKKEENHISDIDGYTSKLFK